MITSEREKALLPAEAPAGGGAGRKPELLLPAGSLPLLRTAIRYGADAVYVGGEAYSLRASADNFTIAELREGIEYAHARGRKLYVTANIYAHERDLAGVEAYFKELAGSGLDGILISDPGIFRLSQKFLPDVPVHISTQANTCNAESCLFWHSLGAKRVVLARELGLSEISEIRRRMPEDMELEAFVHGAMCMAYSGRCLLSAFFTGREANLGACTHPCRWKYSVMEETRPGQYFPVEENERGTYVFHAADLSMAEHIPDLLSLGIDAFKIEGRMKSALYVATVARAYRRALDDYFQDPALYASRLPWYTAELSKCTHRAYSTGFYYGNPAAPGQIYAPDGAYEQGARYLGTVEHADGRYCYLHQKNKFSLGDSLEILKADGEDVQAEVLEILDAESGVQQDACPHAGQPLKLRLSHCPEEGDLLRQEQR